MLRQFPWVSVRCGTRFAALVSAALSVLSHPAIADSPSSGVDATYGQTGGNFSLVRLSVSVVDRHQKAISGIPLHFRVDLDGQATTIGGETEPDIRRIDGDATTNASGVATLVIGPAGGYRPPKTGWFRGSVTADVEPITDAAVGISSLSPEPLHIEEELPLGHLDALFRPTIAIFDRPDRIVDGFPIWSADDGQNSRIAVLLEGFDLYNRISATDTIQLIASAADILRHRGISLLVVNYPDSHVSPDKLAPLAARGIETAARISGRKVALVGLSMGGLVGRWALCEAEAAGRPLPVNSFLMLDSPNRGANLNPSLQAMTLRYGMKADESALTSDAARALLNAVPGNIKWKKIGFGMLTSRMVPDNVTPDTHFHDSFYSRLAALNNHHGYPKMCRVVAIANSSRHAAEVGAPLLYLWLPWGASWSLPALPADHESGSTLPPYYCDRFRIQQIFGIAGAYLRSDPTFVANTSVLDSEPGERPPFDAWYARPDNLPPVPHDVPDVGAAMFAVRELLAAAW